MNLTGYFEGVKCITLHLHEVQDHVKLICEDRSFKSGLLQNDGKVSYFDQACFDTNINIERYKGI